LLLNKSLIFNLSKQDDLYYFGKKPGMTILIGPGTGRNKFNLKKISKYFLK
jgi:hypothetical protein